MKTYFISDLHLDTTHPKTTQLFLQFLNTIQTQADALYILGDLFEYWIGDDVLDTAFGQSFIPILNALKKLKNSGVKVYLIHGNRDFLLNSTFAKKTGCVLLPETHKIYLNNQPTLLMHGDTLCTEDIEYQKFRIILRSEKWIKHFLSLSIPERIQYAKSLRLKSQKNTAQKYEEILDVSQKAVEQIIKKNNVMLLIHGHTHRKNIHNFMLKGKKIKRIVLGDWYKKPSILVHNKGKLYFL